MSNKKYHIGYTVGVFDVLHTGHLNLLEKCKKMCDVLVVGICNDEYVRKIKKREPVFNENDRLRIIKSLKVVDDAEIVNIKMTEDKLSSLQKIGFDVLFSGDDWKGSERYLKTEKQFKKYGASIEYLPYTKGVSTTKIREKIKGEKDG